jgi:hypothetical protein
VTSSVSLSRRDSPFLRNLATFSKFIDGPVPSCANHS